MTKETAVLVSLFCMSRCLDIQIPVSVIKLICLWPVNFGCSAHMPWLLLQQVTLQGMLVQSFKSDEALLISLGS
eukprot:scaffold95445_cov13-Tisochrysis_lutea.AAC.1